jgi:chromosome partitioning protein
MIISVVNQKGGVGKTTTAINLGAALAEIGYEVLIVDLDPQANASAMLNVRAPSVSIFDALVDTHPCPLDGVIVSTPIEKVHLAPGARSLAGLDSALRDVPGRELLLKEALESQRTRYNAVLIDNAPTLGLAPAMSLCAADIALVTVQCQPLAIEGLADVSKTITLVQSRLNPRLRRRILLTMLDPRRPQGRRVAEKVRAVCGNEVCETVIPNSAHLESAILKGGSVLEYASQSSAAVAYRTLAAEVKGF